ncbi:MAG: hypothetical protein CL670_03220 [Balneola sp.]|jgi:hypothetical protein|nr:hypothetical protein [Balneola sp.]|tara:strand:- start:822 stop:1607 length:786 start_codon:yes stop_codon:yes gene_type:complete
MKKVGLVTFLCSLLLVTLSFAQTEEGAYLNIDYLKVDSKDLAQFEELVSSNWQGIFDEEMASENITGTYFYKVIYPGGQLSKYNYVLIRTYQSLEAIMEANQTLSMKLSSRDDDLLERSMEIVTHQYSELWKTEAGIMDPMDSSNSLYLVINYMRVKPGMESQYLALENDIAKPLHEERVRTKKMHNWRTYSIMQPGGVGYDYNFATANYYDDLANIEYGFTNEIMNSVMPSANFTETMDAIIRTRDVVGSELWKLLHYLD